MGSWPVRLRPATKGDVADAVAWYRHEAPEQVSRFRDEFKKALVAIRSHPYLFPEREGPVRLHTMRTFPYGIWYIVNETTHETHVLAVLHLRRDPATVRERIEGSRSGS